MTIIEKKIRQKYFQQILDGEKTYEMRIADFSCEAGDQLKLREWDPEASCYTGRELIRDVAGVNRFTLDQLVAFFPEEDVAKYGFQFISLKSES